MQRHQRQNQHQQEYWDPSPRSRERTQRQPLPMAFPPVGPLQAQYVPPQPTYYATAGPPLMNPPTTPFDTAYGITLLPSHLLIGSPFVSSPDLFQSQQQPQQQRHKRHHQLGMNQSNASHPSGSQRHRRITNQASNRNQNYNNYDNNGNINKDTDSNSARPSTSYPVLPSLKNPPAVARNRHKRKAQHESTDRTFKEPFVVTYRMLPKGDDEYRTRSLLFENVNKSIDLYSFVSKYSRYGPVESIYMFKDREDKTTNSVLLSFLSRKICLDSYNSVLQRLAEFKTGLKSKSLTVSFVSLKYRKHLEGNEIGLNGKLLSNADNEESSPDVPETPGGKDNVQDDAYNVTVVACLQYDIINRGATRSIVIELDGEYDKETLLNEQLFFLEPSRNQRYVLESIYLINAKEPSSCFPKNYAILTFLNISMAVEILDYVRDHEETREKFSQCYFVTILSCPQIDSAGNVISVSSSTTPVINAGCGMGSINGAGIITNGSLGGYNSGHASFSDLNPIGSDVSLDQEIDFSLGSLKDGRSIIVAVDQCPKPFFAEFSDHLSNIVISEGSTSGIQISSPHPQEVTVPSRNSPLLTRSSSLEATPGACTPALSSQFISLQPHMAMRSGVYMEPFGGNDKSVIRPITQSLQKQFATSAEVANSMGGGVGNRTVYIGNIHPRSRPEDICNVVRGGILQNIRFLHDKHICFVTFIEASTAVQFYTNAFIDPIVLHGNMLKVGWGHHSGPLPKSISLAVTVGASRNVYVSLPDFAFKDKYINDPQYQKYSKEYRLPTEEQLRKDFSQYGDIEQINFLNDGHCCWVNFMNISSAIKLVEEVKYNNGEAFYNSFDNRYAGLVIGYGKDRCGNVNKNLVAGRNSRFYKKVKKPSYNIRLSRMEEERKKHEEALRSQNQNNSEKMLQFGSLGIHLEGDRDATVQGRNNDGDLFGLRLNDEYQRSGGIEKYNEEEKELVKLSNKAQFMDGLGLAIGTRTDAGGDVIIGRDKTGENSDEESVDSGLSSNVEFILHSPLMNELDTQGKRRNGKKSPKSKQFHNGDGGRTGRSSKAEGVSAASNASISMNPPMAPSTISRNYSMMMKAKNGDSVPRKNSSASKQDYQQDDNSISNSNGDSFSSQDGSTTGQRGRRKNKRQSSRAIPGSDVMAQYLAQLQHSTFMYAANILGATAEGDVNYYDDTTEN